MQPPNTICGYSEFFKSGFRVFSSGQASSSSHLSGSPDAILNTSSSTPKSTSSGATKRQPRPVSMIVQNTPREKARRRRSSFLSLSSQLFNHKSTPTSFDESSTILSTSSSTSSPVFDSGDSLPEVWITAGGPFTQSARNESSDEVPFIDTVYSSPNAKSTFIDFSQDDFASDSPKSDSFLSFTSSSSRSSIIITLCDRPSSIQTMSSLPSRRSSLQYYHHPLDQEKSDCFWVVEEESDLLLSSQVMEVDHEDWDAPAKIDWRQFHVDILSDDDM
ncbi:hypothetical protein BYT27DRAFT_7200092 [Phlegmacium glaucopus]|nr:hypothetical protein BYT27DRAFT_7200092 [Phlegmacium glaucopus]